MIYNDIRLYIEEVSTQKVECCQCSEELELEADTLEIAARDIRERGWFVADSAYYQVIGLLCPDCYAREPEYWKEYIPEGEATVICQKFLHDKCGGFAGGKKCPHSVPHIERPMFEHVGANGGGVCQHVVCTRDKGWWCYELQGTTRCAVIKEAGNGKDTD